MSLAWVSACGPSAPSGADDGGADTSTTGADDDDDDDDGVDEVGDASATDTDAPGSTTAVDTTAGEESSTGDAAPGCEEPGTCDSCLQWETIVEGEESVRVVHVAIAPDGTIWTVESGEPATPDNVVLRGYDAAGEPTIAHAVYEDAEADLVNVTGLEVADDGRIAIVWSHLVGQHEFHTTLDVRAADGSPAWTHVRGDDTLSVSGHAIDFAEDSSVVMVGGVNVGAESYTGFAGRYGPGDEVAWELNGADLGVGVGSLGAVASTADGEVVLAGLSDQQLWLGRFAADGGITWTMTEADAGGVRHRARDVALTADGDILVVGWEDDGSETDRSWMGRFAADGGLLLSVAFPSIASSRNWIDSLQVSDDGRIFMAGIRVGGADPERRRHAQEVACDGSIAWEWEHVNPSTPEPMTGGGLAWSPRVGLVVGGGDYLDEADEYRQRGFVALLMP